MTEGTDRMQRSATLPRSATLAGHLPQLILLAIFAVAVAVVLFALRSVVNTNGDTAAVVSGTHAALTCIGDGTLTGCGNEVTPYPLLQYLPSALLIGLGLSDEDVIHGLGYLNAVAFVGMLLVAWFTLRRLGRPAVGAALLVALLASPLPWYTWSTFGESLGAFFCLAFVAAALLRAPAPALALTLVLAAISKETALPFLVLMGIGALLWSPVTGRPLTRGHWIAFGIGAVVSLGLVGGFNLFRFDQLTNAIYADPAARTPTVGLKARYVLSLWLAPNAGLVVFWPVAGAALLAMVGVALARVRGWRENVRVVGVGAILLVLCAAMSYGYASWYAPFGWIAWGPRLMLLLMPAVLLFGAATLGPELERLLRAVGRRANVAKAVVAVLAIATAIAQIGVMFRPSAMANLFTLDSECPAHVTVSAQPDVYYHCIIHWAWYTHWVLPDAFGGAGETVSAMLMTLLWVGVAGGLMAAAVWFARRPAPEPTAPGDAL
jgi:hypothetical protein